MQGESCHPAHGSVQDEFLDLTLPVVAATIRQADERGEGRADPAAALEPSVAKALRRRQRGVGRKKVFSEADTVFKVAPTSSDWALVCSSISKDGINQHHTTC